MFGEHRVDFAFLLRRERARITARPARVNAGLDKRRAERMGLFGRGGTDVISLDRSPQALRGGDGLESGNA